MTYIGFLSAVELGFLFGIVALGSYLTFRVLDFPDLTVDGSFPLGAAICASLIVAGVNPWLATLAAILGGGVSGLITAVLNRRFKILHLLAGILTMIALYSINLRIMGRPNVPLIAGSTVLTPFQGLGLSGPELRALAAGTVAIGVALLLGRFLVSDYGLVLQATGANPRMAQANGASVDFNIHVGLAISNGLTALAGALFAQFAGFADVSMGAGTILFGLAAVILGEAVIRTRNMVLALFACVLGSVLYRLAVGLAFNAQVLGLQASDLRLVTALLVAVAFIVSNSRVSRGWRSLRRPSSLAKSVVRP